MLARTLRSKSKVGALKEEACFATAACQDSMSSVETHSTPVSSGREVGISSSDAAAAGSDPKISLGGAHPCTDCTRVNAQRSTVVTIIQTTLNGIRTIAVRRAGATWPSCKMHASFLCSHVRNRWPSQRLRLASEPGLVPNHPWLRDTCIALYSFVCLGSCCGTDERSGTRRTPSYF